MIRKSVHDVDLGVPLWVGLSAASPQQFDACRLGLPLVACGFKAQITSGLSAAIPNANLPEELQAFMKAKVIELFISFRKELSRNKYLLRRFKLAVI